MRAFSSRFAPMGVALTVLLVLLACKKKSAPTQVVASCDLREMENDDTSTCWDVHDKGFAPQVRTICMNADSSGKRWHEPGACDQAGSLGGCQSETATSWHYASKKEPTVAAVKAACRSTETFVPGKGGAAVPPVSAAPASTVPVGGKKACLFPEGRMCAEFENSDQGDKDICDDRKGTWMTECPTENLVGICKGLTLTKFYKPGYATAEDAKSMCTDPGEKFTAVP